MFQSDRKMVAEFDAAIQPFMRKMGTMGDGVSRFRRESEVGFSKVEERANRTGQAMAALRSTAVALGGAAVLAGLARLGDQAISVENQLRGIGAGSDEVKKKIYALAIETRTPIEATVGLLRSMQKSLKDQSLDQTIRQVGTLNRLLTVGGLDGAARGSVSLQFGQALQSGVLQGDELRSLREAAPFELLEAIADAAGGTVAQLRDLGSQGKLTRDVMVRALDDLESTSREKFGDFKMTTAEAADALRTAMLAVVGSVNEGARATETLAGIQQGVARFMLENADAGEVLGQALRMVTEASLLLAGTRGLMLVGGVASDVGRKMLELRRNATLTTAALTGMRGALAVFGGPIGLALFAAGTAFLAISRNARTAGEMIREASRAMEASRAAGSAVATLSEDIAEDSKRLEQVERDIAEAIRDQADAAESTARREKAAIEERIGKNQELLDLQRSIEKEERERAGREVERAGRQLGTDARNILGGMLQAAPGNPLEDQLFRLGAMSDEDVISVLEDQIAKAQDAGLKLTDAQLTFMRTLRDLGIARQNLQKEANGSVEAQEATIKDQTAMLASKAKNAVTALRDLEQEQRQLVGGIDDALRVGDTTTAGTLSVELTAVREKLRELRGEGGGVEDMLMQIGTLAGALRRQFDEVEFADDGGILARMSDLAGRIQAARDNTAELDAEELANIFAAFETVKGLVDGLYGSLGMVRGELEMPYDVRGGAPSMSGIFDTARVALDMREGDTGLRQFLSKGGESIDPEKVAWCAAFINAVLNQNGIQGTGQLNAKSFLNWGQDVGGLQNAQRGDVVVLDRGARGSWEGHVGLYDGMDDDGRVRLLGGNQSDGVNIQSYDTSRVEGVRRAFGTENQFDGEGYGRAQDRMAETRRLIERSRDAIARAEEEAAKVASDAEKERLEKLKEVRRVYKDYTADLDMAAARQELEADMIGRTATQQAEMITRFELLNEAKRRGIDLDQRMAGSSKTYREEIESQVAAAVELVAAEERMIEAKDRLANAEKKAAERAQYFESVQQNLKDGLIDSIIAGEDFASVLGNVATMLQRAALEAALFGDGAMGNGGGGVFGPILNSLGGLFGGATKSAMGNVVDVNGARALPRQAYAKGGIATSPQVSIFGEGDTPEAYVPLPDGRTIPVTLAMPNMPSARAAGPAVAGGIEVHVHEAAAEETRVERSGNRIDVFVRDMVRKDIAGGAFDRVMSQRYGRRPMPQG